MFFFILVNAPRLCRVSERREKDTHGLAEMPLWLLCKSEITPNDKLYKNKQKTTVICLMETK